MNSNPTPLRADALFTGNPYYEAFQAILQQAVDVHAFGLLLSVRHTQHEPIRLDVGGKMVPVDLPVSVRDQKDPDFLADMVAFVFDRLCEPGPAGEATFEYRSGTLPELPVGTVTLKARLQTYAVYNGAASPRSAFDLHVKLLYISVNQTVPLEQLGFTQPQVAELAKRQASQEPIKISSAFSSAA